jgi:DNA-nicking Smr family endonuclease
LFGFAHRFAVFYRAKRYNTGLQAEWVIMSGDGDKNFSEAMSDVMPLKREPRVDLVRNRQSDKDSSIEHRRRAAAQLLEGDRNPLTETGIEPLDAWYVLAFKRPGVQNGVFRKLKQGRYEALSRLDLHRMTAEIARKEIFDFIEESYQFGLRNVLIIHGKGQSKADQERSSILKGCVDHWLRELVIVQAFHSAQPRDGGTGAVYVLLRKSEEKKRENREKFTKGRVSYDSE